MNKYKVSILVPIYNVEEYIESCACSLLEQNMESIEYVFIDDCSPDRSIQILNSVIERYPYRKNSVTIIRNECNLGIGQCRNKAIEVASGEYIYYVDSDDFIEKYAIKILYDKAKNNNLDIVTAEFYLYLSNQSLSRLTYPVINESKAFFRQLLNKQIPSYLCNKLIRRDLFIDKGIRIPNGVNFMEDFATLPRLVFYAHQIAHLSIPLYYYRQNQNSYCNSLKESSILSAFKAVDTIDDFVGSHCKQGYSSDLTYCKLQTKLMLAYAAPSFIELICSYYPALSLGDFSNRFNFRERLLLDLIAQKEYGKIKLLIEIMKFLSRLKSAVIHFFNRINHVSDSKK